MAFWIWSSRHNCRQGDWEIQFLVMSIQLPNCIGHLGKKIGLHVCVSDVQIQTSQIRIQIRIQTPRIRIQTNMNPPLFSWIRIHPFFLESKTRNSAGFPDFLVILEISVNQVRKKFKGGVRVWSGFNLGMSYTVGKLSFWLKCTFYQTLCSICYGLMAAFVIILLFYFSIWA